MDLIYANGTGNNVVTLYIDTEGITAFDVTLTNPCESETKEATFTAVECNGYYEANFFGIDSFYEDLAAGLIYFDVLGSWKAEIYNQGAVKNATNLLQTIFLQITTLT